MDGLGDNLERSPNSSSPYSELFKTAYAGNLDRFKRLALDHAKGEGIGVTEAIRKAKDKYGRGSLQIAAEGGSLQVCKYLIETLKLDVDPKDAKGITPLYHAISEGHLDTVRYLLENGANADASNDANYTPLRCAAETGDTKIITLLLSRGARVDVASRSGTALQEAAFNGHRDAVKVLLDRGANPNASSGQCTHRPLVSAISAKSWECVEPLLEVSCRKSGLSASFGFSYSHPNVVPTECRESVTLFLWLTLCRPETCLLFVNKAAGADPNAVLYGHTPLALPAKYGRVDVIRRLLKAGADPNYKMNSGLTALEIAALYGNYQSVEVLFPVTSRIPTYPDWSIAGLMRHANSDTNNMQREVYAKEKFHQAKSKGRDAFQEEQYLTAVDWFIEALTIFPKDPAVLSNMSACYARLGEGINALKYANKCMYERPGWPKAYYRLGVALNIQKRFDDAADAFNKGLTLDPRNKELKDAYMKAIEARLNSIKVEEDNAE